MIRRFLLIALITLPFIGKAQYHFGELGVSAGPAINIPTGAPGLSTRYGTAVGKIWYSHWVCGKRYGYMLFLGGRGNGANAASGFILAPDTINGAGRLSFNWLEVGGSAKIRKNEYHRPNEISFIGGGKVAVNMLSLVRDEGTSNRISEEDGVSVADFNVAIHLSAMYKHKIGQQSIYLEPGIETYLLPDLDLQGTPQTGQMRSVFLYLQFGYTFWNSKMRKVKGGK